MKHPKAAACVSICALALVGGSALYLTTPGTVLQNVAVHGNRDSNSTRPTTGHRPQPDPSDPPVTLADLERPAENDLGTAVKFAAALPHDEARAAALHECLPQWLAASPEAARAWVKETAPDFSPELLLSVARDVATADPDLAVTIVQRLASGLRGAATAAIFETWAGTNPAAAAARARSLANVPRDPLEIAGAETTDREVAVANVARLWADRDPKAAHAWVLTLTDPAIRRAALETLLGTWAVADPASAVAGIHALPPSEPARNRLFDQVMSQWAASDAPSALKWVQSVRIPAEREAAATTLLSEVVQTQPTEAAEWALQLSAHAASPLVEKVLAVWGANDRPTALAWASALPAGAARETCLRHLGQTPKR